MSKARRFVYHTPDRARQTSTLLIDYKERTVMVPAVTLRGPGDIGNLIDALQGAMDRMEHKAERDVYQARLIEITPRLSQTMWAALQTLERGQLRTGLIASRTQNALVRRGLAVVSDNDYLALTRRGRELLLQDRAEEREERGE